MLSCKVLPLALELCHGGLQVHLPRTQMFRLLLKVGRVATGTLVRQCDPRCLLSKIVTVAMVAHARWGIIVDVVEVVFWFVPREDLEEGAE